MAIVRSFDGAGLADGLVIDNSTAGTGDDDFDQVNGTWTVDVEGDGTVRLTSDTEASDRTVTWGGLTATAGKCATRVYYELSGLAAAESELVVHMASGGKKSLTVMTRPTGQWLVRDSANTNVGISSATMQTGTEYRIETAIQAGSGTAQVYVYAGESTEPVEVLDVAGSFLDIINVQFGQWGAKGSYLDQYWIRNMAVGDDDTLIGAVDPVTPAEPPPAPRVAVIGDSLTYQDGNGEADLTALLEANGWDSESIYWHGVGGKSMTSADTSGTTTVQNIAEAKAALGTVDQWLIALGTNDTGKTDTAFNSALDTVLDAIGSEGEVVWIGLGYYGAANTNAAHFNPLIKAKVEARANSRFCDWNSFIHNGRDETGLWVYPTDSTHMTEAGYVIRNTYYVDRLLNAGTDAIWWIHDGTAWQPYEMVLL